MIYNRGASYLAVNVISKGAPIEILQGAVICSTAERFSIETLPFILYRRGFEDTDIFA
jgi:hypothetical protein